MREWLESAGIAWSVVLTKCDKLSNNKRNNQKRAIAKALGLEPADLFESSAQTGRGLEELRSEIVRAVRGCEQRELVH